MKKILFLLMSVLLLSSCNDKPLNLNVMTFNVRLDNAGDSLNSWQYRKEVAAQIIKDQDIDILGTQEVLANQMKDLKDRLPEYVAIGVGREDGKEKGEYSAIFYKKDKFEEIESGYFWLSETPEVAGSKGWDGACERIATWAFLKDKETEKQVFFINTHLDHVGKIARQEGVTLLLDRATEIGKGNPIILTGDFNAEPESDVIKHVTDRSGAKYLVDTKAIATDVKDAKYTFHDFGREDEGKGEYVDYIFVSEGVKAHSYAVLPAKLNDTFLSDHCPLVAKIEIK